MASALSTFNDFQNITGPSFLTSAESVVNEAQKRNYLLRRFLKGHGPEDVIQGGNKIRDTILGDEQSTFQFYQGGDSTFTWENPQVTTNWEIDWRFAVDHMSWTDQEVELNASGLGRAARHAMYKRMKYIKEQRVWTSILNGMENQLFSDAKVANMEAAGGKEPYSINALVNEQTNGLIITGGETWTTVQTIDPTNDTWWVPQQKFYTSSVVNNDNNIISEFDEMWTDVRFQAPPTKQEYFENGDLFAQFIACSKRGQNIYTRLMRESQDLYVTTSRQDPAYMKPAFAGVDLEYVDHLDTAAIYPADTASDPHVSEMAGAAVAEDNGPRYYWLNGKYLRPVFHTSRYMHKHKVREHPNQPFTHIQPIDSWYNLACRSRQRQGIVAPTGDIYT